MWSRPFTISRDYLLPFLSLCLLIIQLGLSISDLPSIRLIQDIICKDVHRVDNSAPLPEEDCRDEAVQHRLNYIIMGMQISATISATLVTLPLGVFADRIGRLPILAASILSMVLSQTYAMFICCKSEIIPLEAIWGIGVPLLLGGGRSVAEAMVFAIIADTVPDQKRHVDMVPVGCSICSHCTARGGIVLAAFTPETLKRKQPQEYPSIGPYGYGLELDMFSFDLPKRTSTLVALKTMFARPLLWLLPGAVMTIPLATIQTDIIIRLMPIQFDWRLDRSILIISLRSLVTLLTLCILLPVINYIWTRLSRTSVHRQNSILARVSSLLFFAGCLCMMMVTEEAFILAGLIISALGSGLPTLSRAILVGLTGEERVGMLFGMLAVCEIIGFLACETGMGALFAVGLKTWMGMPFCFGLTMSLVITVTAWLVPTRLQSAEDV
ncbi:hypothetical protein KAF25_004565 [Fusarium avenaceum]|uniref:Major facilitator superfamily (MFS) profile domain-containing protein n=1 Tax=Fusarium avenaceum TaxID=40199 RepID=A0A9P7GSX9_9HYPO|nr:hypothetical protein KAF25_004565 [Fusarium avenaceum]